MANIYANKKKVAEPCYAYFTMGLIVKIIGGLGLAFVYTVYYPGGDTTEYFRNAKSLERLAIFDFDSFWYVMTQPASYSNMFFFNDETGYAVYCRDPKAWSVVKIALPIVILSMQSYLATTVMCATISFAGIWRLYKVFVQEFPDLKREMAISFLFIPSVFFWGSGLLKDTFTLSALGFFFAGLYSLFVRKEKIWGSIFTITVSAYVITSIKPYIMVGLIPALIIWIVQLTVGKINAKTVRTLAIPLVFSVGVGCAYFFMLFMGESLAEYQMESILEKAKITQRDLRSDYYQGNSFDIGDFESNVPSIIKKFPIATFSAIFRPLIVESNNLVMFFSGLENLILLIFAIRVLILVRVFGFFKYFFTHHLLTFSLFFSLFFAFSVGLSTSNFGSLVRYKIPSIPYFVASMYIIQYLKLRDLKMKSVAKGDYIDPSKIVRFFK
jgi:hypothetical protein